MNIKYCIQCEEEVSMQEIGEGEYHSRSEGWFCEGPFEQMAPPEMTEEVWDALLSRDYDVEDEIILPVDEEDFVI